MNGATQYTGLSNAIGVLLFPATTVTVASTTFGSIFGAAPGLDPSLGEYQEGFFLLDVTAAATVLADTLDVSIQTTFDPKPTTASVWTDVVHFAQVLGNGGVKRFIDKIVANQPQAEYENSAALAASSVRHIFGDAYRVKVVVAGVGTQSFTFSVTSNWK